MIVGVGDIVLFESGAAGKAKYHFCFFFNEDKDVYSFIFVNSENEYEDHFAVDADRIPGLPANRSGRSVFSCPTVIRKSPAQLDHLKPVTKCTLPQDVAADFLAFARGISSMTRNDKAHLIETLTILSK